MGAHQLILVPRDPNGAQPRLGCCYNGRCSGRMIPAASATDCRHGHMRRSLHALTTLCSQPSSWPPTTAGMRRRRRRARRARKTVLWPCKFWADFRRREHSLYVSLKHRKYYSFGQRTCLHQKKQFTIRRKDWRVVSRPCQLRPNCCALCSLRGQ